MRYHSLEKIFLGVIKLGLWVVPFLPLFVSSSMLFPFITGKNFTFRIIVEVIFALWAGLAVARPEFRPRLTPIFRAVTVFVAIVLVADIFGQNPFRSFLSNYERMEGFMMLSHMYLYFVVLTSVFKTRKDWLVFFNLTIFASLWVSYFALEQRLGLRPSLQGGFRVDSTIGNPTYLAAYLMFHIWLLLILLYEFWKKKWLVLLYGLLLSFYLAILYFTATRGATLAMVGAVVVLASALFILWRRAFPASLRGRKIAAAALVAVLGLPLLFWYLNQTPFAPKSNTFRRLTNYSLEETTIKSRFMIWNMSWQGFKERPILGWGQENYYLVFQKYFDPGLYDQEPWFDRSHNVFFDWLIHAGVVGLLAYLAIFGAVFWTLYRGMRGGAVPLWTGMVLAVLFISYFAQNLFVFDNFNTYFLFFGFLAFSQFIAYEKEGASINSKKLSREELAALSKRRSVGWAAAASLLVLAMVAGYFLHFKPILEARGIISTLKLLQVEGVTLDGVLDSFKKTLSYNTFGNTEAREQLAQFAREVASSQSLGAEDKKRVVSFAVEELKKETSRPAKDSKHLLFLAALLNRSLDLDPSYPAQAEDALWGALELSPSKQQIYFEFAQLYFAAGMNDRAVEAIRKGWELDRSNQEAAVNLFIVASSYGRDDVAREVEREIDVPGLAEDALARLGAFYQRSRNYAKALETYAALVQNVPQNASYHALYAELLSYFGRIEEARRELAEAVRLDPSLKEKVDEFLKTLER